MYSCSVHPDVTIVTLVVMYTIIPLVRYTATGKIIFLGNNAMKKKTRRIVVDDQTYIWGVTEISFNQVCLKVWFPEEKIPWLLVRYRFDDPWLQYGPIITATPEQREKHFQLQPMQPKRVAEIIRQAQQYRQDVDGTVERTLHFHCHRNGEIEPINDATTMDDVSRSSAAE